MIRLRVLFISWHFCLDTSNGASISAYELLKALSSRGCQVRTFCGPLVDNSDVSDVSNVLKLRGIQSKRIVEPVIGSYFAIDTFSDSGIRSLVYRPEDTSPIPSKATGTRFLEYLKVLLADYRPDVVLTYGGYWTAAPTLELIRRLGSKSVFLLQNFAYTERKFFDSVDLTLTLSQFCAAAYRDRFGIKTTPLPPLMRREDVVPREEEAEGGKKYVLFVNPSANKGVYVFARIASEMAKIRPDIPFLVVEGCATSRELGATGINLTEGGNVFMAPATSFPRDFYRHAKLTLVPSVFEETFGRVAAESMISGIPAVVSDRGALPEVIGDAGKILSIPKKYTPATTIVPTAEEVAPWIEEIIRLWDDEEYYAQRRAQALERANEWNYDEVATRYLQTLERLVRR